MSDQDDHPLKGKTVGMDINFLGTKRNVPGVSALTSNMGR